MERRKFGVTDLEVSALCLGTMQFGWTADEAAAIEVMDAFVAAGGNFIDTADVYSRWAQGNPGGVAESIIGRWLKKRGNRDKLVIATKVAMPVWDGPDGKGLGRNHIVQAVEKSLSRLQIETIDLYQSHAPDLETPIEETLRAFDDLIQSGKVRYIGASNYTAPQLEEALAVAGERSLARYISLQPNYSLVNRHEFEDALAALCLRERIAVIPYSPLAGGFLTGKYRPDRPQPKSARTYQTRRYENEAGWRVIEALEVIARARETTLAAVAVAWLLAKPVITSPILGANSEEQLAAILPAVDLHLSPEGVAALDEISAGV
ncbi:MAG: aldo/keto reductase [Dehalococcoidia bacterium]|jgi:aryl-alcohol dehydrogenase-like predicted oxidoreductase